MEGFESSIIVRADESAIGEICNFLCDYFNRIVVKGIVCIAGGTKGIPEFKFSLEKSVLECTALGKVVRSEFIGLGVNINEDTDDFNLYVMSLTPECEVEGILEFRDIPLTSYCDSLKKNRARIPLPSWDG